MSRYLNRRRRGQGMTEYIIIVGLIGIVLSVAVQRFKNQIEVTIIGNEGQGGMTGDITKNVDNQIDAQGKSKKNPNGNATP
jgi:hypothetical protein